MIITSIPAQPHPHIRCNNTTTELHVHVHCSEASIVLVYMYTWHGLEISTLEFECSAETDQRERVNETSVTKFCSRGKATNICALIISLTRFHIMTEWSVEADASSLLVG